VTLGLERFGEPDREVRREGLVLNRLPLINNAGARVMSAELT
jgi:hypothetical protein